MTNETEFSAYRLPAFGDDAPGVLEKHSFVAMGIPRPFQTQTFPVDKSVLAQLTPRSESQILRLYMHHAVESDNAGPYGKMADNIKRDIAYLKQVELGQSFTIGAICLAYNFFVTQDGLIWCVRPANKVPASQIGDNEAGLSVCFDGDLTMHGLTPAQRYSGREFFKFLKQKYNIKNPSDIRGHCDVAKMYPGNSGYYATACPGIFAYHNDLPEIRNYAFGLGK